MTNVPVTTFNFPLSLKKALGEMANQHGLDDNYYEQYLNMSNIYRKALDYFYVNYLKYFSKMEKCKINTYYLDSNLYNTVKTFFEEPNMMEFKQIFSEFSRICFLLFYADLKQNQMIIYNTSFENKFNKIIVPVFTYSRDIKHVSYIYGLSSSVVLNIAISYSIDKYPDILRLYFGKRKTQTLKFNTKINDIIEKYKYIGLSKSGFMRIVSMYYLIDCLKCPEKVIEAYNLDPVNYEDTEVDYIRLDYIENDTKELEFINTITMQRYQRKKKGALKKYKVPNTMSDTERLEAIERYKDYEVIT